MLEHSNVLIHQTNEGWEILEPGTGRLLGNARRRLSRGIWSLGLGRRVRVDVFEAEDEPLVFTVQRLYGFSPKWEIRDADGHPVAFVRRGRILDAFGRPWARLQSVSEGIDFRAGDRLFAQARRTAEGMLIQFAPELEDHPLTKMSLLGAVLVRS
jgi:hypothetical protein